MRGGQHVPDVAHALKAKANCDFREDSETYVCRQPQFFQNTGVGWWNNGDVAETIRTPCGGDSTKANLAITPPNCRRTLFGEDNRGDSGNADGEHEKWRNCGAQSLGLDHVLLSGGTTYQGRGWYDEVSGCLKTMPHGVMT